MPVSAKVRRAIYLASAPIVALLVILGVESSQAAVYVAAALAVGNIIMAALNVPGDDDGDGVPDQVEDGGH